MAHAYFAFGEFFETKMFPIDYYPRQCVQTLVGCSTITILSLILILSCMFALKGVALFNRNARKPMANYNQNDLLRMILY